MRLLIDECLPRQLKGWLAASHNAQTVQENGWANVKNGKLLRLADGAGYDVFLTADANIQFQQNFSALRISSLVIPSNRKILVQRSVAALMQSLARMNPGQRVVMELGPDADSWHLLELFRVDDKGDHVVHVFRRPSQQD